jgi:hypothetical protein
VPAALIARARRRRWARPWPGPRRVGVIEQSLPGTRETKVMWAQAADFVMPAGARFPRALLRAAKTDSSDSGGTDPAFGDGPAEHRCA